MTIVAVMADLMFSVKILDAAKKLGNTVQIVKDHEAFARAVAAKPGLVVFDLNYAPADPVRLIRELKSDPATTGIQTLAFVSHVQVELRQSAVDAGCDKVVARSVFATSLPQLLSETASA